MLLLNHGFLKLARAARLFGQPLKKADSIIYPIFKVFFGELRNSTVFGFGFLSLKPEYPQIREVRRTGLLDALSIPRGHDAHKDHNLPWDGHTNAAFPILQRKGYGLRGRPTGKTQYRSAAQRD